LAHCQTHPWLGLASTRPSTPGLGTLSSPLVMGSGFGQNQRASIGVCLVLSCGSPTHLRIRQNYTRMFFLSSICFYKDILIKSWSITPP